MSERVLCKTCGAEILRATAVRTGGVCMPCKNGTREELDEGRNYREMQKQHLAAFGRKDGPNGELPPPFSAPLTTPELTSPSLPDHWKCFINRHHLATHVCQLPAADGVGTKAILILSDEGVTQELEMSGAGVALGKLGYVPVGQDDQGTGDAFAIRLADPPNGPLYFVDHELVSWYEDGDMTPEVILEHYEDLLACPRVNEHWYSEAGLTWWRTGVRPAS